MTRMTSFSPLRVCLLIALSTNVAVSPSLSLSSLPSFPLSSIEPRLRKCCPSGEIFAGELRVECVVAPSSAMELHGVTPHGVEPRLHGFPRCENPEDVATTLLRDVSPNDYLRIPACLEIFHREVDDKVVPIIVHCRSNRDLQTFEAPGFTLPRILEFRRCCPSDSFFDDTARSCVTVVPEVEEDLDHRIYASRQDTLLSLLPRNISNDQDFLMISRGAPTCSSVIFDYKVDADDLVYVGNSLRVKLLGKEGLRTETFTIAQNNACLELLEDSSTSRKLMVRACRDQGICRKKSCVRKCCPENDFFLAAKGCRKYGGPITPIEFHKSVRNITNRENFDRTDYGLLVGMPCKHGMFPLGPKDNWSITTEGHINLPSYKVYEHHEYCMDIFYNSSKYEEALYPFACFDGPVPEETSQLRKGINSVLQLTSCTFLLLTLLVYACLPVLQNLHGKTLMCHVSSLLLAYTCLVLITWLTPGDYTESEELSANVICKSLGYTMLYAFLSAFCWLNVMCFDIWWTFGGLRGSTSTRGRGHRKRFLSYCAYAWGLALTITLLGIIVDYTKSLPYYLRPNIGVESCWFTKGTDTYAEVIYFTGPVTIQLTSNIVFFVITCVHCSKVKAEISRVISNPTDARSRRFHADRTKLIMNIKLFIVMGISWVLEVISYFLNNYAEDLQWRVEFFYVSDVFNCLQGLLIFILFVLKTRVYVALKHRLGFDDKKRANSNATTALQDPYRVKKSASNSTLMSTFQVSVAP